MAAFNKFNYFVEDLGNKLHNLGSDVLKVALSNVAPTAANHVLADITQITAEHGYASGGSVAANNTYAQSGGIAKLVADDVVFTASGGTIGPFRYAVLYNSSATSKNLIGWWDYGSSVTLADTETFTVDFDQANGILTLA